MIESISSTAGNPAPAGETSAASEALRTRTNQVVGEVFYGTLLRQMQSSTLKGKYGHGGRGEDAFAPQLHQILAQRAGTARDSDITQAVIRRYQRQADAAAVYRQQQQQAIAEAQREMQADTAMTGGGAAW